MRAWQLIETAPKDGTRIIVFGTQDVSDFDTLNHMCCVRTTKPFVYQAYFSSSLWQIGGFGTGNPTHWTPLPEPPTESVNK